jgi:hypothetical protein
MTLRNYSSTAAETTLSAGVDASTTTLTVSATTGFPATPFVLAIDAGAAAQELVLVTNVAGTTLTVSRAFDSTVASAHDTGAVVAHSHAAIDFREANVHINATSGVHGVSGGLVGTSDTQTLTNKTINLGSNNISGTKADFNSALTDGDFATQAGSETLTNKTLSGTSNTFSNIPSSAVKGLAAGKVAASAGVASVNVTFPTSKFSAAPVVSATCGTGGNVAVIANVGGITTSGCTVYLYGVGGTWSSGGITVHWTAVEAS